MRRHGKRQKFISEAVQVARSGQRCRIITSCRDAKSLHAMLSEYEDGSRKGERWEFGPGSVEVAT
jgi:hypothetical protein